MTRISNISLVVLLVVIGALSHAAGAVAREANDTESLLIIGGRVVDDAPQGAPAAAATTSRARPAKPAARSVFRSAVAYAVRAGTDQLRIVRVARASTPVGTSRPWYRAGVKRSVTYVSRPSGDLQLDVWYPRGRTTPAPTIVLVHGGGWRSGGREEWDRVGWTRQLVHRGYVVIAPSYRMACRPDGLSGLARERTDARLCGYSLAQSVVDVRRALGWVRQNVDDHGGDRDRVVMVGASAGGHLALMAGANRGPFVRGVAAISPASDLTWFGKRPKTVLYGATRQAIGCSLKRCPAQWQAFSPSKLATRAQVWPSTYVFDSPDDAVTPGSQNETLLRALDERGVSVTRRHPIRTGRQCHGTWSCSQWMVGGTGRSLFDDIDAWALARVS